MSSPYLSSGESITLTTHRVGFDTIPYDMMLTTQRLTLIDSRYARFEPLMIAFEDILTVKSGTASNGEPVIILNYAGADDIPREMNLIFLQQPGEHRKHERDIWVKKLMESIIAGRQGPADTVEEPVSGPDGMQPSVRRWVAPEGITPHTPFAGEEPDQPEVTIIPDDEKDLTNQDTRNEEPEDIRGEGLQGTVAGNRPVENTSQTLPEPESEDRKTARYDYGVEYPESIDGFIPPPQPEKVGLEKFQTIVVPFIPAALPRDAEPDRKEEISKETILAGAQSLIPDSLTGEEPDAVSKEGRGTDPIIQEKKETASQKLPEEPGQSMSKNTKKEQQAGSDILADGAGLPVSEPDADLQTKKSTTEKPGGEESPMARDTTKAGAEPAKKAKSRKKSRKTSATESSVTRVTSGSPALTGMQKDPKEKEPPKPGFSLPGSRPKIALAVLALVLLIALAVSVILAFNMFPWTGGTSPGPATAAPVTNQTTPAPAGLVIPADGAGFRVIYPGDFAGEVGNPGEMKIVSGTGDLFFPVKRNDGLVQAFIQKQDNSGDTLTVEVYNRGKMIYTRSVSTPAGSLNLLIDVRTGTIAGMTPTKAVGTPTTQSRPMYF
ncbi:MAG: hypothetical protein WC586_00615 [Methanoregula sp.]